MLRISAIVAGVVVLFGSGYYCGRTVTAMRERGHRTGVNVRGSDCDAGEFESDQSPSGVGDARSTDGEHAAVRGQLAQQDCGCGEDAAVDGTLPATIDWRKHVVLFEKLADLGLRREMLDYRKDADLVAQLGRLVGDLKPMFESECAASLEALLLRPSVQAEILAAAASRCVSDVDYEKLRDALSDIATAASSASEERTAWRDAEAILSMYEFAGASVPNGSRAALHAAVEGVLAVAAGEYRTGAATATTMATQASAVLEAWEEFRGARIPPQSRATAIEIATEWLRAGQATAETLSRTYGEYTWAAIRNPREVSIADKEVSIRLRLTLRREMARIQADFGRKLDSLTGSTENAGNTRDVPVFIVASGG